MQVHLSSIGTRMPIRNPSTTLCQYSRPLAYMTNNPNMVTCGKCLKCIRKGLHKEVTDNGLRHV